MVPEVKRFRWRDGAPEQGAREADSGVPEFSCGGEDYDRFGMPRIEGQCFYPISRAPSAPVGLNSVASAPSKSSVRKAKWESAPSTFPVRKEPGG